MRRENLRDFTRYAFYGGVEGALGDAEEAEIEWWIQAVENTWGVVFEPGRTEGQGLTLVHFSAQPKPFWSHLPVSPCLIDWGIIMHPTYPTK